MTSIYFLPETSEPTNEGVEAMREDFNRQQHEKTTAEWHENRDDGWVDLFASAMKEKMAAARAKGRSGWEQANPADLSRMLREHVDKGDPRDVANFCMMLWSNGAGISKESDKQEPIYQIRSTVTGVWHDADKERYELTRFERRIVYAAPLATPSDKQEAPRPMTREELDGLPDWVKHGKPPEQN